MHFVLQALPPHLAATHLKASLPAIRSAAMGFNVQSGNAWFIDPAWGQRSVDVHVGDVLSVPPGTGVDGSCVDFVGGAIPHFLAARPGIGALALASNNQTLNVRVSKRQYFGLARYRYLAAVDDE
jgi:hypothetical protein